MAELERINVDLERRLEQQAKERMKVSPCLTQGQPC